MALQASQLGDLIAATIRDLGEPNLTEIATDLQDHVAMSRLLKDSNMKKFGSGTGLQWDVMVNHSNSARNTGLYAKDVTNQTDVLVQAQADWRHSTFNWIMERREIAMNRSGRRIVELIKVRRIAAMIAWAELIENNFWRAPTAGDDTTPLGVPYWVTKNATAGFNGGILTGYSSVANLSPTTYTRWNNYTFPFTTVSADDFMPAVRAAITKCGFKPPVDGIPSNSGNGPPKWGMYSNYEVVRRLEDAAVAQNENLGNDLASKDGDVMIRKVGVQWVPRLDEDTTNPFYGLNWSAFKVAVLLGEWMNETMIPVAADQHTVSRHHTDCSYQFINYNRRSCFVGSNGTTYP